MAGTAVASNWIMQPDRRSSGVYPSVVAGGAIVALSLQGAFVPARYQDGALPQVSIQAVGGGEVFLEVEVSGTGTVSGIKPLRTTPPFGDAVTQAVKGWRFVPAEEETPPAGPGASSGRTSVASRVLVAALVRPPALKTPTLGEPPKDVASPSDAIPFPVATVTPPYPPLARDSGQVLVEVRVDARGEVAGASVIRSAPPFDESALAAARQWKFRPARLRGTPIETLAYVIFAFRQPVTLGPRPVATAMSDPFGFFRPSIVVSGDEREKVDRGEAIAQILHGRDGAVAVFAAVQVDVDGDRLVSWVRRIAEMKRSPYVLAIGRFSDPPRIEDLDRLVLDDDDLSAIRRCRPGDCGLKLTGAEIDHLRQVAAEARSNWKPALQDAFRQLVLARVQAYLADGHAGLEGYEDKDGPLSLETRFSSLLASSSFLVRALPRFAEYLGRYPRAPMPDVESFVYWSKERLDGKAIVSATHVSIVRNDDRMTPDALVAGKGVFATHYMNASLGLTAIMPGASGKPNYLAYVNTSDVDVVRGLWGGLVRAFMERRFKKEAAAMLQGLGRRLESGEPLDGPD